MLSIQQLFRISSLYWDDKYGTHGVSSEASKIIFLLSTLSGLKNSSTNRLTQKKMVMQEMASMGRIVSRADSRTSSSFLLDDDSK